MLSCKEVSHRASDYLDQPPRGWQGLRLRMHLLICGHCRRFRQQLLLSRDSAARLARKLWSEDHDAAERIFREIEDKPAQRPPDQ
ncbi:zf-HC2 domain-containing protein [Spongiibacter sp.]|uniref:anti-sigma factor family protein n=1 Tax=Spongiibacter sp. TaxID=2024860 RepID=UPI0035663419